MHIKQPLRASSFKTLLLKNGCMKSTHKNKNYISIETYICRKFDSLTYDFHIVRHFAYQKPTFYEKTSQNVNLN